MSHFRTTRTGSALREVASVLHQVILCNNLNTSTPNHGKTPPLETRLQEYGFGKATFFEPSVLTRLMLLTSDTGFLDYSGVCLLQKTQGTILSYPNNSLLTDGQQPPAHHSAWLDIMIRGKIWSRIKYEGEMVLSYDALCGDPVGWHLCGVNQLPITSPIHHYRTTGGNNQIPIPSQ